MAESVHSVSSSRGHTLSKPVQAAIQLVAGLGVEGDAHAGATVRHRSRVKRDPTQPNLRQIHLIHAELFDELAARGFAVVPGQMGENITTRGVDLLALATGALLHIGASAVVRVTGLRNPCHQLETIQPGLMQAVLEHDAQGNTIRKAGIMGVVVQGGEVRPGDSIVVELPSLPHAPLQPV